MKSEIPSPAVPVVHFDSHDFDVADRFDVWRENIGVFFDLASPEGGKPGQDIHARIDACNLGETVFGVTKSESQLFSRDESRVAKDDMDHILVQVFLEGGGLAEGDERIYTGDMLVIDMDKPHAMVNTDFENLTLVLPRNMQTVLSELLSPLHGKRLSSENPMVRFMAGHMKALWHTVPEMDLIQAGASLQGTLGLMEGWLSQEGRLSEEITPEASSALGKSIRRYIEKHLAETLTPEGLAETFRVSRSQIYRIFAPYDGVARYIWERRMLRSLKMLTQPHSLHLTISAIAFECGYTSEAHFSRSFKARFGHPPSYMRAEASDNQHHCDGSSDTTAEDSAEFANWIRELAK
tara:strand:+ start:8589 stop:9641 length:1053 start_codon:yes stop_codon:yes gene_type:complete